MQTWNWAPQHCDALKEFVAAGLSFAEAATAINEKFGTAYTRSAVIGRAKRMKLVVRARPRVARGPTMPRRRPVTPGTKGNAVKQADADGTSKDTAPPLTRRTEPVKLRCVGIQPRLLTFDELAEGDCRYPYGGDKDGEPITFCGHPRFRGTSYCAPHFHLTRGPRVEAERPAGPFVLRLVEAA
jgi:GcrA cell cycle regulator